MKSSFLPKKKKIPKPKMLFKLLLKIVTFFLSIFFVFLKFFMECICFSIQLIFQKLSSEAKGRDKPIR